MSTENIEDEREGPRLFEQETMFIASAFLERFSEAMVEHLSSHRELDKVSGYKLNPEFESNNLFQQAGISAEVKEVSRTNAENLIGRNGQKIARTDNVGHKNHQIFDFVAIDPETGLPLTSIDGGFVGGSQMKVHQDVEKYRYLYKKSFQKYAAADLVLPVDQFDAIMSDWIAQEAGLETQLKELTKRGDTKLVAQKERELAQLRDARERSRKSQISTSDAMQARKSPGWSVFKDTAEVAHRAGVEAASTAAIFGGAISSLNHGYKVFKGEKSAKDAALDIVSDTGRSAAGGYVAGVSSTALGSALKMTNQQVLQNLGKGSTPAIFVQTTSVLAKSVIDLVRGKIAPEELVSRISRDGIALATSLTGSNLGAIIGTAAMPGIGTFVGGFVGGMVASLMSGGLYAALQQSVRDMQGSNEVRQRTMEVCVRLIEQHNDYRKEMHAVFDQFFLETEEELKTSFDTIADAIIKGKSIHDGLAGVAKAFGKELTFESTSAFTSHLQGGKALTF